MVDYKEELNMNNWERDRSKWGIKWWKDVLSRFSKIKNLIFLTLKKKHEN